MSIGSALQTGVNGLRAQATKLATVSDNIANSATVGYKRSTTEFSTLVVNTGSSASYTAGGVTTNIRTEVSKSGNIIGTDNVTDLAIAGNGFFAVAADPAGQGAALTRAGSFRADQFGNLQNAGGYYLQGFPLDPQGNYVNGAPSLTTFASMETVNVNNIQGSAQPTTRIDYSGNVSAGTAGPFQAGIQYFDEFGASQTISFNWIPNGGAGSNVWDLELWAGPVGTGQRIGDLSGIDFTGGAPGSVAGTPNYGGATLNLDPGAAGLGFNLNNFVTADGAFDLTLPGPAGQVITLDIGDENALNGVTQFGGDFSPLTSVDGSALGQLQALDIRDDGTLVAIFDNGEIRPIYQIPLVDVINPEGLNPIDGNAFTLSADSGNLRVAIAGTSGIGTLNAGALENSNVDVAEELTTLIETQRAYSSNATVVQTADEMLEEVTRIGR
ncbi:flagellar hook protein FlgE [Parvularcula lutaonensis]|uniref:Flagellar hook protein FlgE n=1 Tax=Parvularcula lutaonensis TaxID=491923 RepID=A0ABV7MEU9_9PROT|nr:flagellar hook protein FlgE [Parvularcula lutaonensis]GGY50713.1 flagellar hook protein FlgE [Parvularcula lutaonensis]